MLPKIAELRTAMKQHCEVCERETDWTDEWGSTLWCKECGCSKEMFEPANCPGGCPAHPDATHEYGYGLAGGGFGAYSVCNECGVIFDKVDDPEMAA